MSQTATARARQPLNGVDTPRLFATINAVGEQPELAQFTFRATNRWIRGTQSRTDITTFSGAGGDHQHIRQFTFDADHPAVLCGAGNGPTPIEFLLVGLTSCLMAGVANIAAARGITLTDVSASIEGEIDLRGILGLSKEVRNGYKRMRVHFDVAGDAPAEQLKALVEQSRARSAVYDVLTNGTQVEIEVDAR